MSNLTGVLLLNLGGPDTLSAVRPFLFNLFSDPDILKFPLSGPLQKPLAWFLSGLRARKSKKYYQVIGGGSPLPEITQRQARALENFLNQPRSKFVVRVAMRYWHPDTEEAVTVMLHAGVERIVALPLYPQYSAATTGSSFKELARVFKDYQNPLPVLYIDNWHKNPLYLEVMAENIRRGLEKFTGGRSVLQYTPTLLFSAHNLPQKLIDAGDPYLAQIQETIQELLHRLPALPWALSFQSKTGPVRWLEPTTGKMIARLAEEGVTSILVVPISFVSDHLETLYEVDILFKEQAQGLGVHLERCPMPNDDPKFIEALAGIVAQNM